MSGVEIEDTLVKCGYEPIRLTPEQSRWGWIIAFAIVAIHLAVIAGVLIEGSRYAKPPIVNLSMEMQIEKSN